MERSANIAVKEGDVISSAEETLQLDDENLRGEKIKQYLVSIIKYISDEENVIGIQPSINLYTPVSAVVSILISQTLDSTQLYLT